VLLGLYHAGSGDEEELSPAHGNLVGGPADIKGVVHRFYLTILEEKVVKAEIVVFAIAAMSVVLLGGFR
jgi:hypothetical protein